MSTILQFPGVPDDHQQLPARPWLTVYEAADHLGVNHNTIRRAIYRGDLRASRVGPRMLRIFKADLESWISTS